MLARPYFTGQGTFDNTTGAGILEYETSSNSTTFTPTLPPINATNVVANFTRKLRSLASSQFPVNVPQTADKKFFFTVGLGNSPCPKNQTCQGPNGVWFMHCHFDVHLSWGLRMAWIVLDGALPSQKLPPPPSDLPKC
ncbi:hypothetical protein DKX38_013810 [Salix brachista]|uniref:Plastocyanin-like domain-containing protein n=1 Tax=Salix brachista TaxID=2182728 RepID=A0A5N5LFN6_9ROSI|nr:hypothetical protein DKX38_013810 [Salix brachista]